MEHSQYHGDTLLYCPNPWALRHVFINQNTRETVRARCNRWDCLFCEPRKVDVWRQLVKAAIQTQLSQLSKSYKQALKSALRLANSIPFSIWTEEALKRLSIEFGPYPSHLCHYRCAKAMCIHQVRWYGARWQRRETFAMIEAQTMVLFEDKYKLLLELRTVHINVLGYDILGIARIHNNPIHYCLWML